MRKKSCKVPGVFTSDIYSLVVTSLSSSSEHVMETHLLKKFRFQDNHKESKNFF